MKGDGGKIKNKKKTFVHCLLINQVKVASNWPLLLSQKKKKKLALTNSLPVTLNINKLILVKITVVYLCSLAL